MVWRWGVAVEQGEGAHSLLPGVNVGAARGALLRRWKMVLVHPGHRGIAAPVLEHVCFVQGCAGLSQRAPEHQGVLSFVKIFQQMLPMLCLSKIPAPCVWCCLLPGFSRSPCVKLSIFGVYLCFLFLRKCMSAVRVTELHQTLCAASIPLLRVADPEF